MFVPRSKSPEQTQKSRKYDRQLRLWGDYGQKCLEASKICLINASAVGTEILKSLILPGIGSFTIVDKKIVTEEDIGNNFFLISDNLGASRANAATQNLLELNHDVSGDYIDESIDNLLNNNPEFFNDFAVVVATDISQKILISLSTKLWELQIPLIYCKSIGFIGYLRIQFNEHTIIQLHPDNEVNIFLIATITFKKKKIFDFRLDKPLPELVEYMSTIDLESMDLKEHSHVPYLVILYKMLEKFQRQYNRFPENYQDKRILQTLIKEGIKMNDDLQEIHEENFQEAIHAVNGSCHRTMIPQNVQDIFNDNLCHELGRKSTPFWIICKALKQFVTNDGDNCLPVKGSLPDMTSDTKSYISLQKIYHNKAVNDIQIVQKYVVNCLNELGYNNDKISEADIRHFCRYASELSIIRGSSIASEYKDNCFSTDLVEKLEDMDSPMVYYVILRAIDTFYGEYNTSPGEFEDQIEPDIVKLKAFISKALSKFGCNLSTKDEFIHEICRYGGSQLYSVSSFMAGCAAQECIKLITQQYKPLNNSMIYDGIRNLTELFCV